MLVEEKLIAIQKGADNRVSNVLEILMLHAVWRVVNASEIMREVSDAVNINHGFLNPVTALVRSEQRKFVAGRAKIVEICWQLLEAGIKTNPRPTLLLSEEIERQPTDICEDKTNHSAYSIRQSQLGYGDSWHDAGRSRSVHTTARSRPVRIKATPLFKLKHPPDSPGRILIKLVNELFAEADNYRNYCFIRNQHCTTTMSLTSSAR